MLKILIVDDAEPQRLSLTYELSRRGYVVSTAADGPTALREAAIDLPDLILLEVALPSIGGLEVCRRLRETSDVPIVMITARDRLEDKVEALELGADDYLIKPVDTTELIARMGAVSRRRAAAQALLREDRLLVTRMQALVDRMSVADGPAAAAHARGGGVIGAGPLEVDTERPRVLLRGAELETTPTEYALLRLLVANQSRVVTRRELIEAGWGVGAPHGITVLAAQVRVLREKLGDNPLKPSILIDVPGIGFQVRPPPAA